MALTTSAAKRRAQSRAKKQRVPAVHIRDGLIGAERRPQRCAGTVTDDVDTLPLMIA